MTGSMLALGKFRNIVASRVRSLGHRRRRKVRSAPVEGVPEGITFETLNELCLQRLEKPLARVSHVHLSGWKAAGSYRLFLQAQGGRRWRLIYKNAVYSNDQIPALAKLPVVPGPPEYLVYSNAGGPLGQYLPAVYLCSEIVPGRHYQYLLEDLGQAYRKSTSLEAILGIVAELPSIHQAFGAWSRSIDQDRLLRYGHEFSVAFQEYARETLECYAQRTANEIVSEVCLLWPHISKVYLCEKFQEIRPACSIHGDFNPANVLVHEKYSDRIKLVDWEWAGLGMPHADLASLLGGRKPEIEQQALSFFFRQDTSLPPNENRRLYQWCNLERGLLNAAFCAAQSMGRPDVSTKLDVARVIENGARRVLRMYRELV
jgi:hypothetical protein